MLDGAVLDLATLPTRNLNIRATASSGVGSLNMVLSGTVSRTQVESTAPYVLFGHSGTDMAPWAAPAGTYNLKVTAYSAANASGTQGGSMAVNFTIKESPTVIGLTLINADSDLDLFQIKDGMVITLSALPTKNLNIRADVNNVAPIQGVNFKVTGAMTLTTGQSVAPYAIFDDAKGDYKAWTPVAGTYTITSTPITTGAVAHTVTFQVQ
jgi:hypothetical protein